MVCQACGKNTATTHVKTTVNGKLTEYYLCDGCAAQQGYGNIFDGWGLGSLMSGSGSAVFGIFDSKRTAKRCMRKLYNHAEGVFLVKPAQRGAWVFELQD